ncbi:MAG: pentapeptide repeat-containing protein, partial [Isosphaeraceae bacterium]
IVAPLLLVALDLYFRLSLQRLWEELADLPAIFPDGRPLDKKAPGWMLNGLVCLHFERLLRTRSALAIWQARSAALVAWGVVPFTIVILWARYVRMHDWKVTAVHVACIAVTIGAGVGFYRLAVATLEAGGPVSRHRRSTWTRSLINVRWASVSVGLITFLILGGVSASLIQGIAVNKLMEEDQQWRLLRSGDPRVWLPILLAKVNVRAFATIEEVDLSTKPAGWTGKESEIDLVKGADLAGADLRYAEAYGVFLAKGFLKQANLRYADLRAADLRKADLREADLTGANLREAKLGGADLRRANLRDAKLNGADLTGADLEGALLPNAQLRKADLSKADLTRADFTRADLTGAILLGAARGGAIFQGANLADAQLEPGNLVESPPLLAAPPLERSKTALPRPGPVLPSVVTKPAAGSSGSIP